MYKGNDWLAGPLILLACVVFTVVYLLLHSH
jgi:hypothetical protein